MNQDDFRKLLQSGGGGGASSGRKHSTSGNITSLDADGIRRLSAKKSSKKKPHRSHKDHGEDGGDQYLPQGQYRDRAAERRQGVATDMIDADEYKHLDADQSKFLGGDMAHTHLVKGLDFSLLAQLKRERQKLEQATAAEKMKRDGGSTTLSHHAQEVNEDAEPTFQSRMGRMVYFHACQNQPLSKDAKMTKSELFLPGRMYYTFNVLSTEFESIPLAVQRSKEDAPEVDDVVSGLVDAMTISEVRRVLEEKHANKKMRRKRDDSHTKKDGDSHGRDDTDEVEVTEVEQSTDGPTDPATAAEENDDFDIFPDAGEYVPAYMREEEKSNIRVEKVSKGYFANLSASITEAEREANRKEQEADDAWKATIEKAAAAQAQAEREEAIRARAAKLAADQDSYGEYQMGGDDDSDEEGEQGANKRKAADAKKGSAANDVDAVELTRRKKQKQGNKLENDLKKINKLMESKK